MTVSSVTSSRRFNSASLDTGCVVLVVLVLVAELLLLAMELEAEKVGFVELGTVSN